MTPGPAKPPAASYPGRAAGGQPSCDYLVPAAPAACGRAPAPIPAPRRGGPELPRSSAPGNGGGRAASPQLRAHWLRRFM